MDVVCGGFLKSQALFLLCYLLGAILLRRRLEKRSSPHWWWFRTPDIKWMWHVVAFKSQVLFFLGHLLWSHSPLLAVREVLFSVLTVRTTMLLKFDVLVWGGWRGERWHGNKHLRHDDAWQRDNIPHFCVVFCGMIFFPTIIPNGQKMLYCYLVKVHHLWYIYCYSLGADLIICVFLSWNFSLIESISIYVVLHLRGNYM